VNPNGIATVAFAQYVVNTAYPGRTALVSLPAIYNTNTFFATLDGFLLVATKLEHIVDRGARNWPALEQEFPLIWPDGVYQRKVLDFTRP